MSAACGPRKTIVLARDEVPDADAVLDRHVVAQDRAALDVRALADVAVLADHRALHHVGEGPDAGAVAHALGVVDALRMNEDFSQGFLLRPEPSVWRLAGCERRRGDRLAHRRARGKRQVVERRFVKCRPKSEEEQPLRALRACGRGRL